MSDHDDIRKLISRTSANDTGDTTSNTSPASDSSANKADYTGEQYRKSASATATIESRRSRSYNDGHSGEQCPPPSPELDLSDMVMLITGCILPTAAIGVLAMANLGMATEMVLRHPIETLVQYALAASIPTGNFIVWDRIKQKRFANVLRLGLLNGLATGTSALVLIATCAANYFGTTPQTGVELEHSPYMIAIGGIATCSLIVGLHLMRNLARAWETEGARNSQLVYSIAGVLLSLFMVGTSEGRQTILRTAERAALSEDGAQHQAMDVLRFPLLDSENEIKRDIADQRSGGLSGMFLPIAPAARRQLYFALTSRPYESIEDLSAEDKNGDTMVSGSYDRFLASQVVGDIQKGLSLKRSQIRGAVSARTLTSSMEWSFVFKNKANITQEARAEIALPPGAVVSNMTLWIDGKPSDAVFSQRNSSASAYSNNITDGQSHAKVTYLGKGRVLLQCFPVPIEKEVKVSMTMVAPLKLDQADSASLALPRLVASNFTPTKTHDLRLLSDGNLTLPTANLHSAATAGNAKLFVGTVKEEEAKNSGLSLLATRPAALGAFSAISAQNGYTVETVKEIPNNAPKNLVVVLDGSQSVKEFKKDIAGLLGKVEKLAPTTVLVADADASEAPSAISVAEAVKKLDTMNFSGGHDNLPAVVKAAELAGDQNSSAVLWIHGPQPAFNEEIYITSQTASKPDFYELALDDGWTNTSEFLRNHKEIGPMIPVARSGKLSDDLNRFLTQWKPDGKHYSVQLSNMLKKPECPELKGEEAHNLAVLGAAQEVKRLLAIGTTNADKFAAECRIVTPVSSAVIIPGLNVRPMEATAVAATATGVANDSLNGFASADASGNGPVAIGAGPAQGTVVLQSAQGATAIAVYSGGSGVLQGATNGTLAPQYDGTLVQGINTAGTVRVNNLANVEQALNFIVNLAELVGILTGLATIIGSMLRGFNRKKFAFGAAMILIGLAAPGVLNWFVASARDSCLFN